jgi:hypothetical protein
MKDVKENEIAILYNSGLTIREIAVNVSSSYETIRQILKKQKVVWRKKYLSDLTQEQIDDIVKRFDFGDTIKKIADWYEISAPAISRLLTSLGKEVICNARKYDILRATPINSIQKQILVGHILGDGCLYKDSKKSNYKVSISQCEKQKDYFFWKYIMFDPFINNYRINHDKRGNSIMYNATTICHQDFNKFAEMFYDESRVKHIPKNLDIYLTPLALAVWYQDDGNLNNGVNARFATMSFTEQENYMLRDYLKACFDLNSKVMGFKYKNKQYYQITINKENTQKLSDIIRPHVVDCMKYKLMSESSTTLCQTSNKTDDDKV